MGVEDRQGMQQHVARRKSPFLLQGLRVGQQIVLGQHRTFGATRRAGRV